MAVLHGTKLAAFNFTVPRGSAYNGSDNPVRCCFLTVSWSGTYNQTDNVDVAGVGAFIAASQRTGKTCTLLDAAFAAPGLESDTPIGAKTVAVSTDDLTMELTGSDMSTEHAATALATMTAPICLFVSYVES